MSIATSGDIRQLAGLLEGEGCFAWNKPRKTPFIVIRMTDQDVVEWAARILGMKATTRIDPKHPHYKPAFETTCRSLRAIGWMMMVYQFMGLRRKAKIRELIAQWKAKQLSPKYRDRCPRGHLLSGENLYISPHATQKRRQCKACLRLNDRLRRGKIDVY